MFASPHLPTVFLVCCILNFLLSLGLLLVYVTSSTYPGFKRWVIASFSVFFSCTLLAIRDSFPLPPQLTTILVNLTFFAYPLLLAQGLRLFTGKPAKNWIAGLTLTAVCLIALFLLYLHPDQNLRVFLLSLLLVPLFADCGWLVRSVPSYAHPLVKGALIGAFGGMALWNLLRVPLGSVLSDSIGAPASSSLIQSVTLILLTGGNLWISLGVTLLNYARASESLRESETRFRDAMQRAPIGMALVDLNGRWLEVNPALCAIVGYTRDELLKLDFQSITHPDDRIRDEQHLHRLVAREVGSYHREKRYVHKAGHPVWVNVHVSSVAHADGSPRHLVSQIIDVSERRRTEQALRESQTRLMQAMDATKLGHWEFNLATERFIFDDNCYKLLGTTAAAEGGFEMEADAYDHRFLPPEEIPRVKAVTEQAMAELAPGQMTEIEHRFLRADGSSGVMLVRFAIERDAAGRPIRAYGLSQDVTEQARAAHQHRMLEEQLRHAQKMDALGTLAGGIAHDFNNILTGIMGNLQLASIDLPATHPVQVPLREANRASVRARDHVMRVLTFSRRYQGERTVTPLGPVLQEAVQLLRASLPATIDIQASIAADCPPVPADAAQIHQVVMNLGTNAAHAMRDRGGRIGIELQGMEPDRALLDRHPQIKPGHRVRLVVRDNGSGMDAKVLARIFEPFFTTKAPDEGTGLGLAMVHGIVEDHGGAITVASTVGQGTTFTLYFPAASTPATAPAAPAAPAAIQRAEPFGQGRKVMIIDDDEGVLKLGRALLKLAGFVADEFAHPAEALEKFAQDPDSYAAIVSDLTMPGMTGVELAKRCRAIRPDIPFMLTSGYLDTQTQGGAQESGITHFVRKPFDIAEFTAKLRSALERGPAS